LRRSVDAVFHRSIRTIAAKPTITTLQRVTRRESVEPDVSVLPLELFIADVVIVSRITGLARYEILDTASIPPSR